MKVKVVISVESSIPGNPNVLVSSVTLDPYSPEEGETIAKKLGMLVEKNRLFLET